MENILLVGEDSDLMRTRAAVLSRSGACVACCNTFDLDARPWDEAFDLVVLCHTVKPGVQRSVIVADVYRRWPRARVLQVLTGYVPPAGESAADVPLVAAGDQGEVGELLELTMAMLGKAPQSEWHSLSSRWQSQRAS